MRTSRWTSGSSFYAGSNLELKNMEKGRERAAKGLFFHLRDGLAVVVSDTRMHCTLLLATPKLFFFFFVHFFPLSLYACFLLYFLSLSSPSEQSRSKERPKERPRPNWQSHAEATAAVAPAVTAACRPKPDSRIQQGAQVLISCAFAGVVKLYGLAWSNLNSPFARKVSKRTAHRR
jgi:hypothetical protein